MLPLMLLLAVAATRVCDARRVGFRQSGAPTRRLTDCDPATSGICATPASVSSGGQIDAMSPVDAGKKAGAGAGFGGSGNGVYGKESCESPLTN